MFDLIFENRHKKVNQLLKATDSLARSLRENVALLSIDDSTKEVLFLTESNKVIRATYHIDDDLILSDMDVEDAEIFSDEERFDHIVGLKVSQFIEKIYEDDYVNAEGGFRSVLSLWENRIKFDQVRGKLREANERFNESHQIINTEAFSNFLEIIPQLVTFLKENADTITDIPEIKNGSRLSETVAKAFDFDKLSYEDLTRLNSYHPHTEFSDSVYEMICKQELIKKEVLESKTNFESIWATNQKIGELASLVFEKDKEKIAKSLVECVVEVPYLALASKKQLFDTVKSNLSISESEVIKDEAIKKYVANIFEMKKPIKGLFSNLLSEKYGVNINNLKDIPSFRSLINTQVVIFETLSKLSPKGSVQRKVLTEVSQLLKNKNGVESIDVNDYLQILFESAGYDTNEDIVIEDFKMDFLPDQINNINELVQTIMEQMGEDDEEEIQMQRQKMTGTDTFDAPGDEEEAQEEEGEEEDEAEEKEEEAPEEDSDDKDDTEEEPEEETKEPKKATLSKEEVMKGIKDLEDMMTGMDIGKEEEDK